MLLASISTLACGLSTALAIKYSGVDWSSATTVEQSGTSYKTVGGTKDSLENILVASGVNTVRQRVWVTNGAYGLAYNLALAKRAKAAGLAVYLDIHYSGTWADPGHQSIPSGWPTDISSLSTKVYDYTLDIGKQFQSNGIQPAIVSIGNEIRNGLLWPTGKTPSYANIARLLHSASRGIKDSGLNPQPKIMIHIDNGWNWSEQKSFYTNVLAQGTLTTADFDMMGVSYYPFYGSDATLANLKSSLTNMANSWGKELVVAETDWPTSCPNPGHAFPSDTTSIPFSVAGQATWIKAVANVLSAVKGGVGLFYWEPAYLQVPTLGSSCANNLMFSSSGQALSSMSVYGSISDGPLNGGGGTSIPSGTSIGGSKTSTSSGSTSTGGGSSGCSALWGQCGGQGWTGPSCCSQGSCKSQNQWYSQCLN